MRIRFAILLCTALVLGTSGCDEISARRKIQEGNAQYKNGRYEAARDLYEAALAQSPDIAIGHHNLGVTYYKLMKRGDVSAENQAIADKAAQHLEIYLATNPKDNAVRDLITGIWVDTGQSDKALAFWKKEHEADPKNIDVLDKLSGLALKGGDWRESLRWREVEVDVAPDAEGKASAYLSMGKICFNRLFNGKSEILAAERVELADRGIGALQKGQALQPKNGEIVSLLGALNQQRAIASGSRIGYSIDIAGYQNYMRVLNVLKEEAAKSPPAETPAPGGPGKGT
jgi:tetratricopeptide (TPR) repeat protein